MSDVGTQGRRLPSPALRRFAVIVLVCLGAAPGVAHGARARVFNGNAVAVPSYMAYLRAANGDGTWSCGATAISRNVVLTAAHCVVDEVTNEYMDASSLSLVFGQDDPEGALARGTAQVVRVVHYVVPSTYGIYDNGVATNDVAVLETADPVPGTIPVLPPNRASLLATGKQALILGYGLKDASDPDSTPTNLLAAFMPVRRPTACSDVVSHYNDKVMICAGDNYGPAPCPGDSGGPLIVSDPATGTLYEAGVVSFGQECEEVGSISVFARVSGPQLYGYVAKAAQRLQAAADGSAPAGEPVVTTADSSNAPAPFLTFARARSAAASYAKSRWRWTVTRISCARRSSDGIACRVDGRRAGRHYFSRMLVMVDGSGKTAISDAG